eukprot:5334488-Pyramimonas_sp.AAC.1
MGPYKNPRGSVSGSLQESWRIPMDPYRDPGGSQWIPIGVLGGPCGPLQGSWRIPMDPYRDP